MKYYIYVFESPYYLDLEGLFEVLEEHATERFFTIKTLVWAILVRSQEERENLFRNRDERNGQSRNEEMIRIREAQDGFEIEYYHCSSWDDGDSYDVDEGSETMYIKTTPPTDAKNVVIVDIDEKELEAAM